ncbi:MAG: hypothetical protein LBH26_01105, partial [Treponema sp.]|nr:hypothetical protein [Treponema sp.]
EAIEPSIVSAAGGFQIGSWGSKLGAVFVDANISADLGLSNVKGPYGEGKFQRIALGFSVGYKFGFYNRKANAASAALPVSAGLPGEYGEGYEDGEDTPALTEEEEEVGGQ